MSSIAVNPIQSLYSRLAQLGVPQQYVRDIALPKWWQDDLALNPANYAQATILISRSLGLDIRSLDSGVGPIKYRDYGPTKLKKNGIATDSDLQLTKSIAMRAAQTVCQSMTTSFTGDLPRTAQELRGKLLGQGHECINLDVLLVWCWEHGIPVLPIPRFPKKKMMDGLAARIQHRPVIVLSRNTKFSAWLLFILAHELGHLIAGHVADGGVLVDEHITPDSGDADEAEANAFALELLTGDAKFKTELDRHSKGADLAKAATCIGKERHIDPGVIALNYGWKQNVFPIGLIALMVLSVGPGAMSIVRQKMLDNLDLGAMPDESCEALLRTTGVETGE